MIGGRKQLSDIVMKEILSVKRAELGQAQAQLELVYVLVVSGYEQR